MSPEVTYKIRRPVEMLIIRAITDIRFHSLLLIFCLSSTYTYINIRFVYCDDIKLVLTKNCIRIVFLMVLIQYYNSNISHTQLNKRKERDCTSTGVNKELMLLR